MKYFYLLLPIFCLGCGAQQPEGSAPDPYAHISDTTARRILRASVEQAGGLERWQALRRLRYIKDFRLLTEAGEVETEYRQEHDYQWQPLRIEIRSVENGSEVVTLLENGAYSRLQGGTPADVSREVLEAAVNTSVYVVSMPFKLLDAGATIRYMGQDTLAGGRVAEVLEVSYSTADAELWRYYFDKTDARIVANWIRSGDHYSWIDNLSYVRAGGILFNQDRQSFRTDSLGNKLYLRADYHYGHYHVE